MIRLAPALTGNQNHQSALSPNSARKDLNNEVSLSAPTFEVPHSIHTRRPSLPSSIRRASLTVEDVQPRQPRIVQFAEVPSHEDEEAELEQQTLFYKDRERLQRPQRANTFRLPSKDTNLFKWIHVPWNHAGWVPVSHHSFHMFIGIQYPLSKHKDESV